MSSRPTRRKRKRLNQPPPRRSWHQVTAFSRSPQKLTIEHGSLTRRAGSFHDAAAVDAAVEGHDAVIITAAPGSLAGFKENPLFFSAGTALVIDAMKRHGLRRLVVLSSLGTGESRVLSNWFIRTVLIDGLLKLPSQDHERQEALTRASDLEWVTVHRVQVDTAWHSEEWANSCQTSPALRGRCPEGAEGDEAAPQTSYPLNLDARHCIARPGRLTNGPARGRYVKKAEISPVPGSIARADVADFLVTASDTDAWVGKAVQLGG